MHSKGVGALIRADRDSDPGSPLIFQLADAEQLDREQETRGPIKEPAGRTCHRSAEYYFGNYHQPVRLSTNSCGG